MESEHDLAPTTVITHSRRQSDGKWLVRGTSSDNGVVKSVRVNNVAARAVRPNFAEWEVILPAGQAMIEALALDAAGNSERTPHVIAVTAAKPRE